MNRAFLERVWYDTSVPVFLERFILPALATVLIGVILLNPFKFDFQQQGALAIAVVALAYFVGHTVHLRNEATKPKVAPALVERQAEPVQPQTHVSGPATTSGNNSPAITGDGNSVTYDAEGKKTSPKEKRK